MRSLARYVMPILLIVAVLAAGCAARAPLPRPGAQKEGAPSPLPALEVRRKEAAPAPTVPPPAISEGIVEKTAAKPAGAAPLEASRRIIYEAHMVIAVQDPETTAEAIGDLVKSMGGYVAEANLYRYDDKMAGMVIVRVPQERFDEARQRIRELAVRVDREEIKTNDVTSEYVDLQARLKNLEATEEELRALLTEVRKRAQRASDVLEVYRELTQVRSQIEEIKGRLQVLNKLTTYATITVELRPYELAQPASGRWDPRLTLHRAWGTLVTVFHALVDVGIYLVVVVLPVLVIIAIPIAVVLLLVRAFVRRRRQAGA